MQVTRYAIDDNLVILLGNPIYDLNQDKHKDFNVNDRIYKNIHVHLIGNIEKEDYNLFKKKELSEDKLKELQTGKDIYLTSKEIHQMFPYLKVKKYL